MRLFHLFFVPVAVLHLSFEGFDTDPAVDASDALIPVAYAELRS